MIYITTHESNQGDYIISNFEEEYNHDYYNQYDGIISQFDMSEKEFYDKYKLHVGNIFQNIDKDLQKVMTEAAIAYKRQELEVKAVKAFIEYNDNRAKNYLQTQGEQEAFFFSHFMLHSSFLETMSVREKKSIPDLVIELMSSLESHKDIVLNFQVNVDKLYKHLNKLDFYQLYAIKIDDELKKFFIAQKVVEKSNVKSKKNKSKT